MDKHQDWGIGLACLKHFLCCMDGDNKAVLNTDDTLALAPGSEYLKATIMHSQHGAKYLRILANLGPMKGPMKSLNYFHLFVII